MKLPVTLLSGVVAAGLLFSGSASASATGAMLGNTCAGCHGTNGVSNGPATPSIAGISPEYFVESMNNYASNERASTIMGRIARGYTEDEIEAMADFFAGMEYVPMAQDHNMAMAKKGMELHEEYCDKCHSDGGVLQEDEAGFLGGQWKPYTHYQFTDFMTGKREAPKKMMRQLEKMHKKHGDDGIKALLEYYASIK